MKIQKQFSILAILWLSIFLTNCQSKPIIQEDALPNTDTVITSQKWEAKVTDLKSEKSRIVYLQVFKKTNARQQTNTSSFRIEVTGTLSTRVASIVLAPEKISYALHLQKKFFTGKPSPAAMEPMLGVAIDPNILIKNLTEKSKEKNFSLSSESYEILASAQSDETMVQPKIDLFQIETPKNYRTYNLK